MENERYDLILSGGTVFTPSGEHSADVGVRGGRITAIGDLRASGADRTLACRHLHVLPGVIDTQVHFREPGAEHKEDLESGTASAVAGGVTGVFEMPNTNPLTVNAEALDDKLHRARGRAWCDYAFFVGATGDNAPALAALEGRPGCCGVKIFMGASTGDLLVPDDAGVAAVLANGRRRVAVHAEDEPRLAARRHLVEGGAPVASHAEWRDARVALEATRRVVALAERHARPVHVLHVTTRDEMGFLAEHRRLISVEVTPQHLTLSAPECYERLGTLAQMNPPIRDAGHREGLWEALRAGVVDVVGSDHAPHTLAEKSQPYPASPSGMPGVQTLVPLLLDHVHRGRLSLARFVDLTAAGPQRIYNVAGKGRIALGYDADFTVVDLAARRTIEARWTRSRSGWTPFDGMQVTGWPVATIVRGRVVMRDDELLGPARGEPIAFWDCLPPVPARTGRERVGV